MKSVGLHSQVNSIAKQLGLTPSCWLAINSLGNDRTSEIYNRVQETIV